MRATTENELRYPDGRVELIDPTRVAASPLSNADLAPVPIAGRDWTTHNYTALWISMAHCSPTYMLAAGLVAASMNWWQALVTILPHGAYRYRAGVNWTAVVATAAGCALAWIGLVVPRLALLYDYAWFIGFGVAAAVYLALSIRGSR